MMDRTQKVVSESDCAHFKSTRLASAWMGQGKP